MTDLDSPETKEVPPTFLYHGSSTRNLEVIIPFDNKKRDPDEPAQVFAAAKKEVAAIFMTPADDSWSGSGSFDGGKTWYKVIADRHRWERLDHGGAIYTLPTESFTFNPHKGLGQNEFTSTIPVTPIVKEEYSSSLDAMIAMGVQVYFVDKLEYERVRNNHKDILTLLQGMQSENQNRGINVKPLSSQD